MIRPSSAVAMAQAFIAPRLTDDSKAVDATAGNGNDTAFLAQYITRGLVYSFDIQQQALAKTEALLKQKKLHSKVKLILAGHEKIDQYVNEPLDAAMFNLGYLPGGNHDIITQPHNTIAALEQVIQLLKVGGRISLVVYTGHDGGVDELKAVEQMLQGLDSSSYWVVTTSFVNRSPTSPICFFIERVI